MTMLDFAADISLPLLVFDTYDNRTHPTFGSNSVAIA
jgi:hypothetical protein